MGVDVATLQEVICHRERVRQRLSTSRRGGYINISWNDSRIGVLANQDRDYIFLDRKEFCKPHGFQVLTKNWGNLPFLAALFYRWGHSSPISVSKIDHKYVCLCASYVHNESNEFSPAPMRQCDWSCLTVHVQILNDHVLHIFKNSFCPTMMVWRRRRRNCLLLSVVELSTSSHHHRILFWIIYTNESAIFPLSVLSILLFNLLFALK